MCFLASWCLNMSRLYRIYFLVTLSDIMSPCLTLDGNAKRWESLRVSGSVVEQKINNRTSCSIRDWSLESVKNVKPMCNFTSNSTFWQSYSWWVSIVRVGDISILLGSDLHFKTPGQKNFVYNIKGDDEQPLWLHQPPRLRQHVLPD